jgi:hypothetical protein
MNEMWSESFALQVGNAVIVAGGLACGAVVVIASALIVFWAGLAVIIGPRNIWRNWQDARIWARFGKPKYRPPYDSSEPQP